ncbi:hypothetical protein GCM10027168_72670 [Streptomyces capparidis]
MTGSQIRHGGLVFRRTPPMFLNGGFRFPELPARVVRENLNAHRPMLTSPPVGAPGSYSWFRRGHLRGRWPGDARRATTGPAGVPRA